MSEADVTAIVVTHQSASQLGACMQALEAAAAGLVLERIVIDNASGDGTAELVAARWPDVRLLRRSENLGFARAVNEAAREAVAPLLLLLNPDARMGRNSLRLLVDALGRNPTAALAGPRLVDPGGAPRATAWRDLGASAVIFEALMLDIPFAGNPLHVLPDSSEGPPRPVPCLSGACLLVRRRAFEALGGFDERFFLYHEDFDLCRRARSAGHAVLLVPDAVVEHDTGGSALHDRRAFLIRFHTSHRELILKRHPGWTGRALAEIHRGGIAIRSVACRVRSVLPPRAPWRERARDWQRVAEALSRKNP